MSKNNLFKIAHYNTNVDLSTGITGNLAEIELALARNPNTFEGLALVDQARGDGKKDSAFPTGWNGFDNYSSKGFSQDIWRTTGIGSIKATKLDSSLIQELFEIANENKDKYAELIESYLINTGSTYQQLIEDSENQDVNLGITTFFEILEEMQTGSPLSVDYLLEQSNTLDYFNQNPHAIILSSHAGSYLVGGNPDGPEFDLDISPEFLQVEDFSDSLSTAIDQSPNKARLGLVAYDQCLMANIETLTQLSNDTRYLLASQETIPGNGFDYFLTLSDFKVTTPLSTQAEIEDSAKGLGNAFVDTYTGRNGSDYTLSLSDTNSVAGLNEAIKNYADELINSSDSFIISLLKSIRQKGTSYTAGFLQDLGNVALITKSALGVSTELENASNSILSELSKTVINNNQSYEPLNGFKLNSSSGLTITLPTEFNNWLPGEQFRTQPTDVFVDTAPKFEESTGWSRVLDRIYPLLSSIQTNSGSDSSKAKLIFPEAPLTQQTGNTAFLSLQIDEFLSYTSSDQAINQTKIKLPEFESAIVADIELHLNVLNLNSSGVINIGIEDQNGKKKASWKQSINDSGLYSFIGADLSNMLGEQEIESGDSIVITPDNTVAARYDLDLAANGQSLEQFDVDEDYQSPILLNSAAVSGEEYSFNYVTPVAPQTSTLQDGFFTTDLTLLSSEAGEMSLKIKEIGSDLEVQFTSDSYIDEYIKLSSDSAYEFTISYVSDVDSEKSSSDISLLVDHYATENFMLKEAILTPSIKLSDWGQYTINQELNANQVVVEMVANKAIDNINDLREGQLIDVDYGTITINNTSTLMADYTGGNQTFFSGIWSSENPYTFNTTIEGTGENTARFGFFEVDDLTGGIKTNDGLIAASNSDAYKAAALDNLIAPLVGLEGRNKSGTLQANINADTNYAAILCITDGSGKETALFSLASANPNQNSQLLDFGNGFYGWEDLVQGRDAGFDGDFNDITFYTT